MIQKMYIGPSIPGVAKKGTVFIGGIPEQLQAAIKEIPEIGNLVAPLTQITKATRALREQGSIEEVSYERASQYRKQNNIKTGGKTDGIKL